MAAALIVLAMVALVRQGAPAAVDSDAIVFVEDSTRREPDPALAPPVLPVLEHLERDPSTLKDNEITFGKAPGKSASPRFGVNAGFGVVPTGSGGFTASFSHGLSGLGGSQAGSHSLSVGGAAQGFQVSQTSSQASSFGGSQGLLGSSLSGSQSSSQSSSFSAGLAGLSSSSSGASSSGLTGGHFGQGFSSSSAQSQSAASSFGLQGQRPSSSFPGGQSFANGQSGSGSFGNGGFSQATGGGFSQNGFNQNSNAFSGSAANSQSFAGANQNGNGLAQNSNSFSGSVASSQSFNGFNQNPSGFNSLSGSAANSQSSTGAGAAGRPLVGDVRRRPAPPGRDGQRFGSPIVFPGPTNNNRLRSLQYSKRLSSGLVPPDPARGQQFRPPRRRPSGSAYQVIRVEV